MKLPTMLTSLLLSSLLLHSCLGLDEKAPECYPNEGCALGYTCEAGKCIAPPMREVSIKADCISSSSCQDNLVTVADNEEKKVYYCLALEQPSYTHWLTLNEQDLFNEQTLMIQQRLNAGALRTYLFAFATPCPEDTESASALALPQNCKIEKGCLFQLRHEEIEVIAQDVSLNFSADEGQCKELTWSVNEYIMPKEECSDAVDNDCDGFVDEGKSCRNDVSPIDSSTTNNP